MHKKLPYRIDLCGGWHDQPIVNRHFPGAVVNACIEPDFDFDDRSGMATSTRKTAAWLWPDGLPKNESPERLGRVLFAVDNPPGSKDIAGSQDAFGIVAPGLHRLDYSNGNWWPDRIETVLAEKSLGFLENHVFLAQTQPRVAGFEMVNRTFITPKRAEKMAAATDLFWQGGLECDLQKLASGMAACARQQWKMFPNMVFPGLAETLDFYRKRGAMGWKLSGAGGGGYLILVSKKPIDGTLRFRIRRSNA